MTSSLASMNAQHRARYAFKCVDADLKGKDDDFKGKYKSHVKKLPMLIKTNGLGATLAYIRTKAHIKAEDKPKKPYSLIEEQIADWLVKTKMIESTERKDEPKFLVESVINMESSLYKHTTIEVLAFLNWLRRFVDGLIEGDVEE